MTYSYDPEDINERGLSRMRFELGDVQVLEPDKTAYLSDEEITAALEGSSSWRRAKLRLVESLLRRFSYEVDTKVDKVEWKLHQRVDEWKELYKKLRAELQEEEVCAAAFGFKSRRQRPAVFGIGLMDWGR